MVGERIKELREQNGYTQTELAKKLRLSRSAINAWEMGTSVPSTQYLVEISSLFNTSSDYILGISREESVNISYLADVEKRLIYAMMKRFREYHSILDALNKNGIEHPDKDYGTICPSPIIVKPAKNKIIKNGEESSD